LLDTHEPEPFIEAVGVRISSWVLSMMRVNERFEEADCLSHQARANPFAIAGGMDSDAHEIAVFTV